MSFRIYVGNYPTNFTKEDVRVLFKEFDGIIVEKCIQKGTKCFSFCVCTDIDQLVSVIKSKNNSLVFGRKLRVRADSNDLQDYVDLLIKDDYDVQNTVLEENLNKSVINQNYDDPVDKEMKQYSPTGAKLLDKDDKPYEKQSLQSQVIKHRRCAQFSYKDFVDNPLHSSWNTQITCVPSKVTTKKCDIKLNDKNSVDKKLENSRIQTLGVDDKHSDDRHRSPIIVPLQVIKHEKHAKLLAKNSGNSPFKTLCDNEDKQEIKRKTCEICFSKNIKNSPTQSLSDNDITYNTFQNSFSAPLKGMTNLKFENIKVKEFDHNTTASLDITSGYQDSYSADCSNCSTSRTSSSISHTETSSLTQYFNNDPIWLSFTNFPFGTTIDEIYDLFSDFDPLRVVMIHNRPARNKRLLSEAHVCFSNEDIVTDVILNFDNTMFKNRRVFVTQVNDLTLNNELIRLNFNS